jgi:HTH-type transcriptional regulator / antitoxin MqsA
MTGKWNGKKCPVCGKGTLHDEVRKQSVTYRGKEFVADQFGAYCDQCGDGVSYRDQAIEKSWEQFKSAVDRTERVELAAIRKRLGLTQKQAAQLAGGGHNAFSRYERGEAQPVAAVVNLFSLLDRHPELLTEFGIREPAGSCAVWQAKAIDVVRSYKELVIGSSKDPFQSAINMMVLVPHGFRTESEEAAQFDFSKAPLELVASAHAKSSRY